MQRVTITLDDELMAELDAIIGTRGYQNRSEAIRDLARAGIREATADQAGTGECVAALIYVYDHAARQLSKRLAQAFHDRIDMSRASLRVYLDRNACLDVNVLQGRTSEVREFGERIIAERGVRDGKIVEIALYPPRVRARARRGVQG
jgi:CopG family transcriptional regulator, nickel-responsive regulator